MNVIDTLTGQAMVLALTVAAWIGIGGLGLLSAFAAGAWWQQRRPGGCAEQRRTVEELTRKLADAEARVRAADASPARLQNMLFDAELERDLANEAAAASSRRAELQRNRADAAAGRCADLSGELFDMQGALERALSAGRQLRDGVGEATAVLAHLDSSTEWEATPGGE